jgi:magnesium transporter
MLVSSPLKPSAPSTSLLRFLRAQSDSVFFFTPNPTSCTRTSSESPWQHHHSRSSVMRKSSSLTDLTPVPCRAQLEASLFAISSTSTNPKTLRLRPSSLRLRSNTYPLICPLQSLRNGSTKSRSWMRRFLDLGRLKETGKWRTSPQVTTFTDDGSEGNLFNLGRALAAKSLNEPRLRCTEFDENGNVTLVNGEYRKSELIAKVS